MKVKILDLVFGLVLGELFASATNIRRDSTAPPSLEITKANLTSKWFEGSDFVQVVEMFVNNTDSTNWLTSTDALNITITSDNLDTVIGGTVKRLQPGGSVIVQVGVKNKDGVPTGTECEATASAVWGTPPMNTSSSVSGLCGLWDYEVSEASIDTHLSPDWFNDVKYGIFIHWGVYSAPAYGSTGTNENYAEWYWNRMHNPSDPTQTYQYHAETYGEDFNYDDFLSNFTASNFDPKAWTDLFADAGAQYLVPVTKHHDGWALFESPANVSMRSLANMGPQRDFIKEILDAAATYHPDMRRGTYYSLPEWYNPLYKQYARSDFPGGPPVNPYTNETLEYTGFVNISDYVTDFQLPHMNTLAFNYNTDIMWCDIGGANNSTIFASNWLNWARSQGRQVTLNSRCGITGDYDTPEYSVIDFAVPRKWESCRGMDPFSFGYNYQTPDEDYLTPEDIVQTLVDITSKNGNFLLDVGPTNEGLIPDIMQKNLLAAGSWIKAHGESLFKTRYWQTTPGQDPLRYTTTADAFYIHVISPPNGTVHIPDPIPFLQGDNVTVIGGSMAGTPVNITGSVDAGYDLQVSDEVKNADSIVWTFKITYN